MCLRSRMNQLIQSLNAGTITKVTVPVPQIGRNSLLIQASHSLISAGTERMLLNFSRASLFGKIKQQPEKVKDVLQKIKTDGLLTTLDAVQNKLSQEIPIGYSSIGVVSAVGTDVQAFKIGDRVVSNGPHAEVVSVSQTLCAKIPATVSDEEAVFTVLGAIALQGVRLAAPTLGECFVVIGLGLIGLITVQLLKAHGCRVLGVDFDADKCALARQFGADTVDLSQDESLIEKAAYFARGQGVDAVLITASAKKDSIVHEAATISRKRGRIVLIGVVDLSLRREDFYEKELSFQVSCSYGPGRYDSNYEDKGQDYPLAFVRWTEQRNFEAVLDMMESGQLNVKPLISAFFSIDDANKAYEALKNKKNLGLLFKYTAPKKPFEKTVLLSINQTKKNAMNLAFIGAGNYASRLLIPAFKKTNVGLHTVVTQKGFNGVVHGKKFGFRMASTDFQSVLNDSEINIIVIATRHYLHARQVIHALQFGKHVYVEKPLCLTLEELEDIKSTVAEYPFLQLMCGFNRRFSPFALRMKALLSPISSPKHFVMTINAGAIPGAHWTQDASVGGGRLIGEACHFVDFLRFLAGVKIVDSHIVALQKLPEGASRDENFTIILKFEDGSCGSIHYFSNGHKSIPKERLEIFSTGKILQLDNFTKLIGHGFKNFKKMKTFRQDKGQDACARSFVNAILMKGDAPIPVSEIFEVMEVCIHLRSQLC